MTFSLQFSIPEDQILSWFEATRTPSGYFEWDTEFIRKHFFSITELAITSDQYSSVNVNAHPKDGIWLVNFWQILRKQELLLKEEITHPSNRADSWGYSFLKSVQKRLPTQKSELSEAIFWFQLGRFETPTLWKVDKHQIEAILNQEADDAYLFLCPSFNRNLLQESVDRLPDYIDVYRSPSWEILYENKVEGSKVIKKAVGVIHKLTLDTLIEPREKQLKREVKAALEQKNAKQTESKSDTKKKFVPNVHFSDIGGIESILQTIREVIELPLKNPALFEYLNIKPHKGILLHGPPGCGKTMIAKAIANEINAHFISVKGPELLNKYYGQSEENLRMLFEEAAELQPTILFFDEIDAVAQNRSSEDNLRIEAKFVNQLLTLMDGIEDYGSVCVIAATNRPELLDKALLRPGRFDYQLLIPKPDAEGCRQIFELNTKSMPVDKELDTQAFSNDLHGLTGAEISFVAREGAYNCLRRNYSGNSNDFETMSTLTVFEHLKIIKEDFRKALNTLKNSN